MIGLNFVSAVGLVEAKGVLSNAPPWAKSFFVDGNGYSSFHYPMSHSSFVNLQDLSGAIRAIEALSKYRGYYG